MLLCSGFFVGQHHAPRVDAIFASGAGSGIGQQEIIMTDKKEALVVASKLKNYIREKSGMNTSAGVIDVLSDKLREMCDRAMENARNDGRKTVKDRDF